MVQTCAQLSPQLNPHTILGNGQVLTAPLTGGETEAIKCSHTAWQCMEVSSVRRAFWLKEEQKGVRCPQGVMATQDDTEPGWGGARPPAHRLGGLGLWPGILSQLSGVWSSLTGLLAVLHAHPALHLALWAAPSAWNTPPPSLSFNVTS